MTQQTFYLLAAKGGQLRDLSKLKSWLMTTCYREFLKHVRHAQSFPHCELADVEDQLPQLTLDAARQMDGDAVMREAQTIDELYRVPLLLFYLQQHSYKEIAEVLEVPVGTVMSRLARGKEMLKERLRSKVPKETGAWPATEADAELKSRKSL